MAEKPKMLFDRLEGMEGSSLLVVLQSNTKIIGRLKRVSRKSELLFLEDCMVTLEDIDSFFPWFLVKTNKLLGIALLSSPLDLKELQRFLEGQGMDGTKLEENFLSVDGGKWRIYRDRSVMANDEMRTRLEELIERFSRTESVLEIL